ncbi:MAG TPA: DUF1287 domain-containing protein [Thermoanaerobaculia bacterium]|nr:DUF1287 domain-containing protein [Thermoanaerobaculia bacterium]
MKRAVFLLLLALPLQADVRALVIEGAKRQVGVTRVYDPSYQQLRYPGGDVPPERGVCADVVVRAFRHAGLDLQQLVHDDMASNFGRYPRRWGLRRPDANIDHRRVPNLETYFARRGKSLAVSRKGGDYQPGDIVAWRLPGNGLPHIGVVSDVREPGTDRYRVVHNIGYGTQLEDVLFAFEVVGHFRW